MLPNSVQHLRNGTWELCQNPIYGRRCSPWRSLDGFGSGYVLPAIGNADDAATGQAREADAKASELAKLFLVGVRKIEAVERVSVFPVRGITEASRTVEVRARTSGIVEDQAFDDGDRVKAGDLLCQLDTGAREAQMARASAQLASAQRDHDATTRLASNNFAATAKVASDKAAMQLAAGRAGPD